MAENTKNNKDQSKDIWIHFRIDPEMKKQWSELCKRRGETEADAGRRLIENAIDQGHLEAGLDGLIPILKDVVRDVLTPHTERLVAINAKTAIAAGTSMYMNTQVVADAGYDAKAIYEESRKKAIKFVQEKQQS